MIEVITIANRPPTEQYYCWAQFHDSLARFGYKALILGLGEPWGGLMTKPRKLQKWLREGTKADLIAVCDSWDSVWQKSPTALEKEFEELKVDMLIGAERACFPDHSLERFHPQSASSFRYVNTGMIVARPKVMLQFLDDMELDKIPDDGKDPDNWHPNDQHYVMLEFLKRAHNSMLDTQTKFVANLHGVKKEEIDYVPGGGVRITETGNTPFVIHFNGGSKTDGLREPILKHLGHLV